MNTAVSVDQRIMHGTPCFAGTRVTLQTLFDWLEEGHSVDYFLEQFPTVRRDQVLSVLRVAKKLALQDAVAQP